MAGVSEIDATNPLTGWLEACLAEIAAALEEWLPPPPSVPDLIVVDDSGRGVQSVIAERRHSHEGHQPIRNGPRFFLRCSRPWPQ